MRIPHTGILPIPHTLECICRCWASAESVLIDWLEENQPAADENDITKQMHALLSANLRMASEQQLIVSSFLSDLRAVYSSSEFKSTLPKIARGLIADATLHTPTTEGRTGGDMGLQIIRPNITESSRGGLQHSLHVNDYRRGLLSQAKMKQASGRWGDFTDRQKEHLSERIPFMALLLYSHIDAARTRLRSFQWQHCFGYNADDVMNWLKRDSFPDLYSSTQMLWKLGQAQVGTDDVNTIDLYISPQGNPSLSIYIWWPPGKAPGAVVRVERSRTHRNVRRDERVVVKVRA